MVRKIQSMAIQSATLALAIAVGAMTPAAAQQVGTATAVNPSSEGTPPGGSTTTLTIGAHVLHKERIHTSPTGSLQLLFLDKSTLSIAPNTTLVIDEFVYDPASNSGHMLTKLTQGTLQYIGGQLSHQGAVTIGTPAATIGIRGGIGIVSVGPNGTQDSNLNGVHTIQNGTGTQNTITGFTVDIAGWNSPPGAPYLTPPELVDHHIIILSSVNTQTGSGPPLNGLPTIGLLPQWPWLPTNTGENGATQIINQATQHATEITPPPPPPPTIGDFSRLR
jgi:hypothetical protein